MIAGIDVEIGTILTINLQKNGSILRREIQDQEKEKLVKEALLAKNHLNMTEETSQGTRMNIVPKTKNITLITIRDKNRGIPQILKI
jgi:hypothetical protein